ncbi:MAG: GIN domain-containing protein [Massilia sp.]
MKTALKLTILAAALAAGAIVTTPASYARPQDAASGVTTEQRTVAVFSAIELAGPYHVVIDAQATPSLELSGERKQLAEIETVVRGDTLVVRPMQRNGFFFNFGKRRETVTVHIGAAALKRLTVAGSGDVEIEHVKGDSFTLAGSGPGDVHASGAVRQLTVTSSGSGDLALQHLKAADVDLTMTGPGDVQLADVGGTLSAQVGGSGDLEADGVRAGKVTARMRGPGNIKLSGSARELDLEMSGSGDFEGCDLRIDGVARSVQRGPGNACLTGAIRKFDGEVDGSGELAVRGLQAGTAQLRMNGPGNVALAGTVGDLNAELAGSGDLDGRGLTATHADIVVHGPGTASVNVVDRNDRADAKTVARGQLLLVDRSGSHTSR